MYKPTPLSFAAIAAAVLDAFDKSEDLEAKNALVVAARLIVDIAKNDPLAEPTEVAAIAEREVAAFWHLMRLEVEASR